MWGLAGIGAVCLVVTVAVALSLDLEPGVAAWIFVGPLPILAMGTFLFWRRPEHRTSQQFLVWGVVTFCLAMPIEAFTVAAVDEAGPPSWTWLGVLVFMTVSVVGAVLGATLIGLLPDGRFRYRWERSVLLPLWGALVVPLLAFLTNERVPIPGYVFPGIEETSSPLFLPALGALGPFTLILNALYSLVFLTGMGLLVIRYRKGDGRERRQVRLVLLAAAVTVGAAIWPFVLGELGVLPAVTHGIWATVLWLPILLLPASIVVAVLEPTWLDVDLAIRKTFVYGTLSFVILALYVAVATISGVAAGARLPLEVAILITVGAALLFQPARRWLQSVADRWVFGERPTGYEAVTDFTSAVRRGTDPRDLARWLAETTLRALGLRWIQTHVEGQEPVVLGEPSGPPKLVVAIEHGDDSFGRVECGPKSKGGFAEADVQLVTTLASQTALALYNTRLAVRIVHAQEAERRRIERNIHDGAQQELVALVARLGMARSDLRNERLGEEALAELQREVQRILSDLRELAQGIHPSVLSDGGLLEAIEDRCGRLPIEVSLEASPGMRARRFPDEVEGAAYFFVTEGVSNILKHAGASRARIAVHHEDGVLALDVSDDGVGFEPWRVRQTGLAGLSDRIRALGGSFVVTSTLGQGARLRAVLPVVVSGGAS